MTASVTVDGTESVVLLFISPHESLESQGWRLVRQYNGGSLWSRPSIEGRKIWTSVPVTPSADLNGS